MTHVTCGLTAKNRDQLRNLTLGNRVQAAFSFFYLCPAQFCRAGQLATVDTCSSGDAPIQSSSPSNSESSSGSDISSESGVFSGDDVDEYAALPTSSDISPDRFSCVCTTLPCRHHPMCCRFSVSYQRPSPFHLQRRTTTSPLLPRVIN